MTTDEIRQLIAYHSKLAADYATAGASANDSLRAQFSQKSQWHARMSLALHELLESFETLTTKVEEVCLQAKKS